MVISVEPQPDGGEAHGLSPRVTHTGITADRMSHPR
jgi:hypothetical protein